MSTSRILGVNEEHGFVPHIENQVDDGEVGEEGVFVLEDLVVWLGMEVYRGCDACVGFCLFECGVDVEQFAAFVDEGFVEVYEEGPRSLVEGTEIVLEVFEEGRVEVGGLQGVPMLVLPIAVGADAHILHQAFAAHKGALVHGDGKGKRTVGRIDGATVAKGLLVVVLVLFNEDRLALLEGNEP